MKENGRRQRTSEKEDFDVIVAGAGVAGLAAACWLARNGRRVLIVEARERVGGRVWNEVVPGWPVPVELGAEFIHGGNAVLERWMRRARLGKRPVTDRHWWVTGESREEMNDAWEKIDGVMTKIGPSFRGSFGVWMKTRGRKIPVDDLQLAATFVEGFQGAPVGKMSARSLFQATQAPEEQARVAGGYSRLIEAMLRELKRAKVRILTGQVIEKIVWRRGFVRVVSRQGSWSAGSAVVTLPLGVLKAASGSEGAIRFSPALKTKQKLWKAMPVGHALRVVMRFRPDVWRRGLIPKEMRARNGRAFGFLHSRERYFPVWWSEAPAPVLVGWTGGPAAEELAHVSPRKKFSRACQTLSKLLSCSPSVLRKLVVDFRIHDWTVDPFTRGAYSFSIAGLEDAPARMAKPEARTLFFAGEATADPLELGTVHGALASGERAAKQILEGH